MRRLALLMVFLLNASTYLVWAQGLQIKGKVTSADDGSALPGASVVVKGTNVATVTDAEGNFIINAPQGAVSIIVGFIGMKTQEVEISGRTTVDIVLQPDIVGLEEVVVTALGISRDKKSLGYATQEVRGEQLSTIKSNNFINALSGKVAGVLITKNTNIGGSTNIIVRGSTSLSGNNQALFVVDGIPYNNDNTNTDDQSQDGSGYDYGNAASDINPENIESVNVLKGAAATALYGSRAANGVVMITTKKGNFAKKGIGVSVSSNINVGYVDKSTFPEYQKQYGAGYGAYWIEEDMTNDGADEQWSPMTDDASNGFAFDPNLMIYQWDAVDPELPNYMKATPWVAAKSGPIDFFENPVTYVNTVSIENTLDKATCRLSYTNYKQNGLLPNSELLKNNALLNVSWNVSKKLTASGSANYISTSTLGRNSTGYNDNIMTSYRQWYETNINTDQLKDAYFSTNRNVTWNWADPSDPQPIYWDNPYWVRYKNYETDSRNRFTGFFALNYKITDWLEIYGRASSDFYSALEEERKAVGSIAGTFGIGSGIDGSINRPTVGSGYLRRDISFTENNYDAMLNLNKNLNEDFNLKGILGLNVRRTNYNRLLSSTNGGLAVPEIYSIQNTKEPLPLTKELASKIGVDGIYGNASVGYKNFAFIEGSLRQDHSSTLPANNSTYYYPSITASFIFSEILQNPLLSFGKIRVNYAEVGNSADFDQIKDVYNIVYPYNTGMASVASTKRNSDLKPERTKSIEGGLELYFLDRRVGLDLSVYKTNTINQIVPLALSKSTGFTYKVINAGEIENKGLELVLSFTPIKYSDLKWDISVNWSKNISEVMSLYKDGNTEVTNLQLGSYQQGVTVNARVGEPYGMLEGTDYVYLNGKKVIDSTTGYYLSTPTSNNNLGKVTPDWKGGVLNTITYKNWAFSFLIDMQQGGKIFSLDMAYGLATGLYKETAFTNDLGNPVRDPIADGGGMINEGVNENGNTNTTRMEVNADENGTGLMPFGYYHLPNSAFVYDASYVKLREVSLTYNLPSSLFEKTFIKDVSLSAVGSNLWIIHKNIPYADPESGLGSGNLQGYSIGSLPSTRDFGFNVKFTF